MSSNRVSVDICICTFQRPYLAETLRTVAAIDCRDMDVRVIVSDNDSVPSAQSLVELIGQGYRFPILYLHSPATNISIARNACLEAAQAEFVAFIDDDEWVSQGWLAALMATADRTGADAVLGPVRAVYGDDAPAWMINGDFHSTAPVLVGGNIVTGYTCNVLVRWNDKSRPLRFDLSLGRSGGEDHDFFCRLHDRGGHITQAEDALVYEPVPPSRASMGWLLRRRLRSGQTHGMRLRSVATASRARAIALASLKAAYCLALAGVTAFSAVRWRRNLLRATLHMGVVGGIAGSRQAVLYGQVK